MGRKSKEQIAKEKKENEIRIGSQKTIIDVGEHVSEIL